MECEGAERGRTSRNGLKTHLTHLTSPHRTVHVTASCLKMWLVNVQSYMAQSMVAGSAKLHINHINHLNHLNNSNHTNLCRQGM